ncbi:MAG: hypothetical protein WA740_17800, partial [Candidatus Binataceae bacterium]
VGEETYYAFPGISDNEEEAPVALPVAILATGIDFLVNFFEDLFSGSENPPIPRQLMHKRHPLYVRILGVEISIVPTEGSSAPVGATGAPSNTPPLQKAPMPEAPKKTPSVASKYQACLSKNLYSGPNSPIIPMCVGVGGLCIANLGEPVLCLPSGSACMALVGIKHCCQQIARGKGSSICLQILEPPIP